MAPIDLDLGMLTQNRITLVALCLFSLAASAQMTGDRARARDLGVPFEGTPGQLNAITDVPGIEVGATTLIRGDGPLKVGEGPVRTGVTVIFPRGKQNTDNVYAGWFSLNGNGEMTGTTWLEEAGLLKGPVGITNTHSVGRGARFHHCVGCATEIDQGGRVVIARGGGDLGWLAKRHQWLSREAGGCFRCAGFGEDGTGC